jgi:hypothetical protein
VLFDGERARVQALETDDPVSASRASVSSDGSVVQPSGYDVVRSFGFEREALGPKYAESDTALHIEPELDRIVRSARQCRNATQDSGHRL